MSKKKKENLSGTALKSVEVETQQDNEKIYHENNAEENIDSSTASNPLEEKLSRILTRGTITIAYASTTGTCKKMAQTLHDEIIKNCSSAEAETNVQLCSLHKFDWWDELLNKEEESKSNDKNTPPPVLVLFLPTWTNGTLPPPSESSTIEFPNILESLHEITTDWRVPKKVLMNSDIHVSVFGMGSSEYNPRTFCKPAKEVHRLLIGKLGAYKLLGGRYQKASNSKKNKKSMKENINNRNLAKLNLVCGDESVGNVEGTVYEEYKTAVLDQVRLLYTSTSSCDTDNPCACASNTSQEEAPIACCGNNNKKQVNPQMAKEESDENDDDSYPSSCDEDEDEPEVMDMEDMGNAVNSSIANPSEPIEMVTPKQAKALKKEGYRLIGTHSAVKLCRWTKHQLRGRGGCYKHTFYGITSYQCMEATPSLACANKCVFCWRHHKNPVGTYWKWKTDDPYRIVDEAVNEHVKMIKETKGIPGVLPNRWKEAHTVRHCALSLVGEPIMYPRINELLSELHNRDISTFLVTNGQHPKSIDSLVPVTQLYVSVDAPTPESLEAIDRPLFKDAWDRLRHSLQSLRTKGQRTVARLTVVKGWNSDEIGGYAELIALGCVSLIEVKGVTFCGKSDASNLNMTNTPWHHEVRSLTLKLRDELATLAKDRPDVPKYGLACEHKHSCSVLLAREDQFSYVCPETQKRKWRTWINYEKFQELVETQKKDPSFKFTVEDYVADTPDWALSGAEEEGFDPTDTRHYKKRPLYTKFDDDGIPTHDKDGKSIPEDERIRLRNIMEEKRKEMQGDTEAFVESIGKGGEKKVVDVSLMFRGMVVAKQ